MPDTYEKDYHLDIHGKHYSRIGMLILILVGTFGAMLMQTYPHDCSHLFSWKHINKGNLHQRHCNPNCNSLQNPTC